MTAGEVQASRTPRDVGLRWVLVTLCVTEITSWGVLFYAFTVLSEQISVDTGWSAPKVTAAFSAGLVTSALMGMVVGRWLDRYGPRWIMTIGSILAVLAVLAVVADRNDAQSCVFQDVTRPHAR
jgi:MFS family permease